MCSRYYSSTLVVTKGFYNSCWNIQNNSCCDVSRNLRLLKQYLTIKILCCLSFSFLTQKWLWKTFWRKYYLFIFPVIVCLIKCIIDQTIVWNYKILKQLRRTKKNVFLHKLWLSFLIKKVVFDVINATPNYPIRNGRKCFDLSYFYYDFFI